MSTKERTVQMANQIARNFLALDHDAAARATADHIARFWDPRMKRLFFEAVAERDGLEPTAWAAGAILREEGAPAPQTPATVFGAERSDAG